MLEPLALDGFNRAIVVATTSDALTTVGTQFLVVDGRVFGLIPERGPQPTPAEQLGREHR